MSILPLIILDAKFYPMKRIKSDKSDPELSFYNFLRADTFNYEEFKENALQRIKVLRRIENNIPDFSMITTREQDNNTHFSLRLVAAQKKWSSSWFINQETQLFKYRLKLSMNETRRFFIEEVWPKLNIKENIEYNTIYNSNIHNETAFDPHIKIHFTRCSEIISRRIQIPKKGYLCFNDDVMIVFLSELFRQWLSKQMDELYEKVILESDERLITLNNILFSSGSGTQNSNDSKQILQSTELFPLCIKGLLERLKTHKHLKYNDRQILCLFLKDIGMGINECIDFFKSNFGCTTDEFNKNYLYNIRHNYGLEGKCANYKSFPCSKIIGSSNDGVSFGCPFINNHEFVRLHSDIEDISKDAIRCCGKVGAKELGNEFDTPFYSPADYFRILHKNKSQENN